MPVTTGFTNSRWLGLGESVTSDVSLPVERARARRAPWWYFTSPVPRHVQLPRP